MRALDDLFHPSWPIDRWSRSKQTRRVVASTFPILTRHFLKNLFASAHTPLPFVHIQSTAAPMHRSISTFHLEGRIEWKQFVANLFSAKLRFQLRNASLLTRVVDRLVDQQFKHSCRNSPYSPGTTEYALVHNSFRVPGQIERG